MSNMNKSSEIEKDSISDKKLPLDENSSLKKLEEAYAIVLNQRQAAIMKQRFIEAAEAMQYINDNYHPFSFKMAGFTDMVNNTLNELIKKMNEIKKNDEQK